MNTFAWIEYSVSENAIYCYACRQFGPRKNNEMFVTTGFNQWKMARVQQKGLLKHDDSTAHKLAMSSWVDKRNRETQNKEIS